MKVLLVLSCLFLPVSVAISQPTLFWGPEASIHFSSFSDRNDYQPFLNGRILPGAGIQGRYFLSDNWSIRTGIRIDMTGFRRSAFTNTFFSGNFPLIINYETPSTKNKAFRAFLGAGVRISYIFTAAHKTENEIIDLSPYLKPLRIEAGLEAGIRKSMGDTAELSMAIYCFPGISETIPYSRNPSLTLSSLQGMIAGLSISWQWKRLFNSSKLTP